MTPFQQVRDWLQIEEDLGSPEPNRVVLATAGKDNVPHSRIVAIREVSNDGLLFFTQTGTRKYTQIQENRHVSMTIWLPMQQRQVILEGVVEAISKDDCQEYWEANDRERQLKFGAYFEETGQEIESFDLLNNNLARLRDEYHDKKIPMPDVYCGFRLMPSHIYFYTLGIDTFSEVFVYHNVDNDWKKQQLSP
jgi:pyridoxamine 5'-phosphate oxidase